MSDAKVTYRPHLDGLRTVAVYLVVAFHASMASMAGGFIGVDVFFVLSGFLVTMVVVTELRSGRFSMATFYNRRVRRLLPAALVVLLITAAAWVALASPVDRTAIIGDVRSAALYFSNWHFAAQATSYFAHNASPTPVLHFWSLSVEEQFYLAWPLVLWLIWRISRGDTKRAMRGIVIVALAAAALSLASLWWTLHLGKADLAYYGTHSRVYQLLGGAALAVAVMSGWLTGLRRWLGGIGQVIAALGLLALSHFWVDMDPSVRGVGASSCALLLVASLEVSPEGLAGRVLRLPWLVYLGQISYATYLWHYPITVAIRRFVTMPPWMLALVVTLLATGCAALSQVLLEMPIRRADVLSRLRRTVPVAGLALSVAVGALLVPLLLHADRKPVVQSASGTSGAGDRFSLAGFDVTAATQIPQSSLAAGKPQADPSCERGVIADCIIRTGKGQRVLLLGDSHARMLIPTFRTIAAEYDMTLASATHDGCPWARNLVFKPTPEDFKQACVALQQKWYQQVIPAFRPDLIVLDTRATDEFGPAGYAPQSLDPTVTGDISQVMAESARRTASALISQGYRVVIVEPVPVDQNLGVVSCLTGAEFADQCDFPAGPTTAAERAYRAFVAAHPGKAYDLNLDPFVCPRGPVCDAVISGTVTRIDHDHLTPRFAAQIAGQVRDALLADGLLGRAAG